VGSISDVYLLLARVFAAKQEMKAESDEWLE
jgi:hypothetical protein